MLKKLRVRFVCTTMAIVLVMLGIIFGTVLHFTGESLAGESLRMMESVAESLKKKLETSYVLNGSAISHQPLFSLHQFINYSYLCQAASAAGERVCKSHLFLQASVSLDFS